MYTVHQTNVYSSYFSLIMGMREQRPALGWYNLVAVSRHSLDRLNASNDSQPPPKYYFEVLPDLLDKRARV